MYNSLDLWNKFITSFTKHIKLNSLDIRNRHDMTNYYKNKLFQEIAKDLNLEVRAKEYLRVDIVLCEKGDFKYEVPVIFIESENDPRSDLPNEIHKLLSVNAPLKILLTRDSFEPYLYDQELGREDTYWYYPLKDFAQVSKLNGYFGVISATWLGDRLMYEYLVYDENGNSVGDIQKFICERHLI